MRISREVDRRVAADGSPPAGMSESSAFKEITATSDLYNQEPTLLAGFDIRRLKILGRTILPKDARQRLPRYAEGYPDHLS
eukprot:11317372-Karenia_brevis.AAC.1